MQHLCPYYDKQYNCHESTCQLKYEASCNECYDKGLIEE